MMSRNSWLQSRPQSSRRKGHIERHGQHLRRVNRCRFSPLRLEVLEDRMLLSTFHVVNPGDSGEGSLRAAILAANAKAGADNIVFASDITGPITLASQLTVTDDLKILGPGADRLTISGGGTTRVFEINGSTTEVRIDGLTVADGKTSATVPGDSGRTVAVGGGILNTGADLTISNVTFVDNQAVALAGSSAAGGAIANIYGATLTVRNCTMADNQSIGPFAGISESRGGAIYNDVDSILVVRDSTFTGNQAVGGSTGPAAHQGGSLGGAIENAGGSTALVTSSTFEDNLARGSDGNDATLASNGRGGAIDNWRFSLLSSQAPATLTVRDCTFSGNEAIGGVGRAASDGGQGSGGAIVTGGAGSLAVVIGSVFTNNLAQGGDGGPDAAATGGLGGPGFGGALNTGSADLTVKGCWFEGNVAIGGAGAVGLHGGGGGTGYGGGIYSGKVVIGPDVSPTLRVQDSDFVENLALGGANANNRVITGGSVDGVASGGGICTLYDTLLDVRDSRFFDNEAIGGAGAMGFNTGIGAGGAILAGVPIPTLGTSGCISDCLFEGNLARGGEGGLNGKGGNAQGGGVFHGAGTLAIKDSILTENQAIGGAAGASLKGGDGLGGGLFNFGAATLTETTVTSNKAIGGAASAPGVAGKGIGAGIFNLGEISIAALDLIYGNYPDDCFGC